VGAQSTAGSARLLIDYAQPERDAVLDLLFKPQFGASLQHLKVEIGGDGQISCGAEASGQRGGGSGAADWGAAGYEGWLMAEAKKRSPDLALLGLVYAWPAWVNPNGSSPWASPATEANAAAYVTAWVQGMHAAHNLSIDWVGLWNEREYTQSYVFTLRAALDAAGFAGTQIVGSDRYWDPFATDYLGSAALRNATGALSQHYPNCDTQGHGGQCAAAHPAALAAHAQYGTPLYSTEDYSCWTDDSAAVHWASKLNSNFIGGNTTFYSAWYLLTAFYPSVAFWNDGLLRASQPWGGNYELTPSLWATAHTTQFTQRSGWRYLVQGAGAGALQGGGTYVTLVDALGNVTIVIEAAGGQGLSAWSGANCNAYQGLSYSPALGAQNATFVLSSGGGSALPPSFALWRSRFQRGNRTFSAPFERLPDVAVGAAGEVALLVEPDAVYTLSTFPGATKALPGAAPPSAPFPLPYADDFEGTPLGRPGRYWSDMHGGLAVARAASGVPGQVLRQVAPAPPCCNFIQALGGPLAVSILGAATWRDVQISVDVGLQEGFALVGVRAQFARGFFSGGLALPAGVFLALTRSQWRVVLDVASLCGAAQGQGCSAWGPCAAPDCLLQGALPAPLPGSSSGSGSGNATKRVTLGARGAQAWALVNGVALPGAANISLPPPAAATLGAGFVALGGTFSQLDFDNVLVEATAPSSALAPPAAGQVLRALPCGDPAAASGSQWALSPPLQGERAALTLRANAALCLAPGEGSLLQLAPCNASLPPTQAWRATGTQVVHEATGQCLGSPPGAFPGSLAVVRLVPCGSGEQSVYWSPSTGFLHTPAQAPLEMVCLGAWGAPPPPPPPPPPPQAAAFSAAGRDIALSSGGGNATWAAGGASCNHVALLTPASAPAFWLRLAGSAQFVDIGFCTPDIALNFAGPGEWMGYAAGHAWLYRASGLYQTAAPPPGQGVPYGAPYGAGDIVTAIRRSSTQLEFLLNGASQGLVALPAPGIPAGVVGCAGECSLGGGGAAALSAAL